LSFPAAETLATMRSLWNHSRAVILIACLGLFIGCATDPTPKKVADDDPLAKQARRMRANSVDGPGTGLSEKSRAIESDLGYN
jgi:hypothetical protein